MNKSTIQRPAKAILPPVVGEYIIPCLGEEHRIIFAPNGHIGFCNHDISVEVLLNRMGGKCVCALIFDALTNKVSLPDTFPYQNLSQADLHYFGNIYQLVSDFCERRNEISSGRQNNKRRVSSIERLDHITGKKTKKYHIEMLAYLVAQRANILAKEMDIRIGSPAGVSWVKRHPSWVQATIEENWLDIYKDNMAIIDGYFVFEIVKRQSSTRVRVKVLSNQGGNLTNRYVDAILENGEWRIQAGHKQMLDNRLKDYKKL